MWYVLESGVQIVQHTKIWPYRRPQVVLLCPVPMHNDVCHKGLWQIWNGGQRVGVGNHVDDGMTRPSFDSLLHAYQLYR